MIVMVDDRGAVLLEKVLRWFRAAAGFIASLGA
jgi:hypothetical protein